MSAPGWIDPVTGRASCPACDGHGYHDDGTQEGELCAVCDGRGVATAEDAERWLAETEAAALLELAAGELASYEPQRARCGRGEHNPATVPAQLVVYALGGRRRPTGETYCRFCGVLLP